MYIEMIDASVGKDGRDDALTHGIVRWNNTGTLRQVAAEVSAKSLRVLAFIDGEFFADEGQGIQLCREMRTLNMNVLWSAFISTLPSSKLLREMRLAGCQRLELALAPEDAEIALERVREFGFALLMRQIDGTPYAVDCTTYTVAEREAIVERLPGLHSVQFDLAVAYFKAQRFSDVMLPLGKAMTLRFPLNELCLNLLACLSAAKHYPDMAAGLLKQAQHGCPHPVVFRNRELLKSWLESGGDVKGVRLMLEPDSGQSTYA